MWSGGTAVSRGRGRGPRGGGSRQASHSGLLPLRIRAPPALPLTAHHSMAVSCQRRQQQSVQHVHMPKIPASRSGWAPLTGLQPVAGSAFRPVRKLHFTQMQVAQSVMEGQVAAWHQQDLAGHSTSCAGFGQRLPQ